MQSQIDRPVARQAAALLGIGAMLFGAVPLIAPRAFGRLFQLPVGPPPAVPAMIQAIGARDLVLGAGLWSAASHGGNYAPWLLARALVDSADSVTVALAIRNGVRQPRFIVLGVIAVGAAALGWLLYAAARQSARASGEQS